MPAPPSDRLTLHFLAFYEELVGTWSRRLGNRADAEDVAQETMLRALQSDVTGVLQPRAWLHRAARNVATDAWRRRSTAEEARERFPSGEGSSDADGPEQALRAAQLQAQLEAALAELPLKCRQVFVWQRLDGLSQAEIAERLGLSRNSIERYMIRALRHLRERVPELPPLR